MQGMKLGPIIKAERKRLKWTQQQLATEVDVGSDVVSKYERGVLTPSVPTLQKMARAFGKTMDELCADAA